MDPSEKPDWQLPEETRRLGKQKIAEIRAQMRRAREQANEIDDKEPDYHRDPDH